MSVPILLTRTFRNWKRQLMLRLYGSQYKPGHFYSTIPSEEDFDPRLSQLLDKSSTEIPGIEMNLEGQKQFLNDCLPFYKEIPFPKEKTEGLNYYYKNLYFTAPDAVSLFLILRKFQPKRIVEIGSGFSSAVIIDTNEKFFGGQIKTSFVEPFPDRLNWFLSKSNNPNYKLYEQKVQDVPMSVFEELGENDFLLIDSSHVSKLGSDVNHLFFNVLPRLKKGVVVHVHDISYPFEYPSAWVKEKRFWNEAYLLRSFLTFNSHFEIVLFNGYIAYHHKPWLKENMPILTAEGGSIYMKKIR